MKELGVLVTPIEPFNSRALIPINLLLFPQVFDFSLEKFYLIPVILRVARVLDNLDSLFKSLYLLIIPLEGASVPLREGPFGVVFLLEENLPTVVFLVLIICIIPSFFNCSMEFLMFNPISLKFELFGTSGLGFKEEDNGRMIRTYQWQGNTISILKN